MKPIFSVEFRARNGNIEFEEESVTLADPEALFAFVAPGGGCEAVPDQVDEIHLTLVPSGGNGAGSRVMRLPATLQIGMVYISGPLGEIVQTLDQLSDRAEREQLSASFLRVIGVSD